MGTPTPSARGQSYDSSGDLFVYDRSVRSTPAPEPERPSKRKISEILDEDEGDFHGRSVPGPSSALDYDRAIPETVQHAQPTHGLEQSRSIRSLLSNPYVLKLRNEEWREMDYMIQMLHHTNMTGAALDKDTSAERVTLLYERVRETIIGLGKSIKKLNKFAQGKESITVKETNDEEANDNPALRLALMHTEYLSLSRYNYSDIMGRDDWNARAADISIVIHRMKAAIQEFEAFTVILGALKEHLEDIQQDGPRRHNATTKGQPKRKKAKVQRDSVQKTSAQNNTPIAIRYGAGPLTPPSSSSRRALSMSVRRSQIPVGRPQFVIVDPGDENSTEGTPVRSSKTIPTRVDTVDLTGDDNAIAEDGVVEMDPLESTEVEA